MLKKLFWYIFFANVLQIPTVSSHVTQFPLPECSLDSECPAYGQYYCLTVQCIDGFCLNTSTTCPTDTPVCDEVQDTCVQCLEDIDCTSIGNYESELQTMSAQQSLDFSETITPLTTSWCDVTNLFEFVNNTEQYAITNLYSVQIFNITITVNKRCNTDTFVCETVSNTTDFVYGFLNQSLNITQISFINADRCSLNTTHSLCNEDLQQCEQCHNNADCTLILQSVLQVAFPNESFNPSDFCKPIYYCHNLSGKCVFAKVTQTSPSIYTTITDSNYYSFLDTTNTSAGIEMTALELTELATTTQNISDFFETLFRNYDEIKKNPCDFVDQRNRSLDVSILQCNDISSVCNTIQCQSNVDCSDENECNGEEPCNMETFTCTYPITSICPEGEYCDNETSLCQECLVDSQCEPENPCDGIGICLPDTENEGSLKCSLINRCNTITEWCDPDTNITEILSWYGYTSTTMPGVPSDRRLGISEDDDTYDIPPTTNNSFINGSTQITDGNSRKNVGTRIQSQSTDQEGTAFLPPNFDWRRTYCKSFYCENSTVCPIGTICKIYTASEDLGRKCRKCISDAECQDGVKCNGRERCHPEGTCRRSFRNVCEQYLFDNNITDSITNFTCLETIGSCIRIVQNNTNMSDIINSISVQDKSKLIKTVTPVVHSNIHILDVNSTTTSTTTPISTSLLATAIVIPIAGVAVVFIAIIVWLSMYQQKMKKHKHRKNKDKKKYK